MTAEVQVLVIGFDYLYIVRHILREIIDRLVDVEAYKDSRTLLNTLLKDGRNTERRLQIYISALR